MVRIHAGQLEIFMSDFRAIILAAGKGTRMKSETPKVLHQVAGRPILEYVLEITKQLRSLKTYVVVGHGADAVKTVIGDEPEYILQDKLLGTADAVNRCASAFKNFNGTVLILCGDTPLLSKAIVAELLKKHKRSNATATVLTAILSDPHGYGRMVRDAKGNLQAIREQKDTNVDEDKINEINVGVYCFKSAALFNALTKVKVNPNKKEFYLTDVVELLLKANQKVDTLTTKDETVAFGVNTRMHLAQAQAVIRERILKTHMDNGVTIVDPLTTYIDNDVKIGADTVIYPCTFIHEGARIGSKCSIGPFARIRPGSKISDGVQIGNFTEVSRTSVGRNTNMKHFSFLGDAKVGSNVNIGAGTITANYDGKHKNVTTISDGAFIGSDSVLVAPVKIGKKAVIGAGSLVTRGKNIPAGSTAYGVPAKVVKR